MGWDEVGGDEVRWMVEVVWAGVICMALGKTGGVICMVLDKMG